MSSILYFDIETTYQNTWTYDDVYNRKLIAFCSVDSNGHESQLVMPTNEDDEIEQQILNCIRQQFKNATKIVAFNGSAFDFIVLKKYFAPRDFDTWLQKSVDPMTHIKNTCGFRCKLEDLSLANGGTEKVKLGGKTEEQLWRSNEHQLLLQYCSNDARILKHICELSSFVVPSMYGNDRSVNFNIETAQCGLTLTRS